MGCIESETANTTPVRASLPAAPKRNRTRKMSRMSTKFKLADLREITDDERHSGYSPCYACPICFIYYNSTSHIIQKYWPAHNVQTSSALSVLWHIKRRLKKT